MLEDIPNCFYRISIKALIYDEQKRFLLIKENNWLRELPGGGLDFWESPQRWISREIQEEMWLEVTSVAEHPSYFFTSKSRKGVYIANVLYETTVKNLDFTPSEECVEIKFFSKEDARLENNLYPNIQDFLKVVGT